MSRDYRLKTGGTGSGQAFGPVIERQISTSWLTEREVLDLDDGRLLWVPTNVVMASMNNPRPMLNWMVKQGADLLVTSDGAQGNLRLHLDDGRLFRIGDDSTFDSIAPSASDLGRKLAQSRASEGFGVRKAELGARPSCVQHA